MINKLNKPLEVGKTITLNIPFTYKVGEDAPYIGKKIETLQDCLDVMRAEIKDGTLNSNTLVEFEGKIFDC